MEQIYWLQRLAWVSDFCSNVLLVSLSCLTVAVIVFFLAAVTGCLDEDSFTKVRQYAKKLLLLLAFLCIGSAILPDKQDLWEIYGIGGTIDYIKSNDKAKELPDKVVDALTRYVDSIEQEKKDK